MTGTLMKTNVTVTAASLTLTHCSEKVNTALGSVSESQIQFDGTHRVSVFECSNNIPTRQFINVFIMIIIIIIIIVIK
jgi:hypothetical protein